MSANNGFFLFENPNIAIDLSVAKLIIAEIPQGCWYLILSFMIEKHMEGTCVVIYLELGAHRLIDFPEEAAD